MATIEYADCPTCAQCGLPIIGRNAAPDFPLFCCHACRLVSAVVGRGEEGEHAWGLLRLGIGSLLAMNIMMISLLLYTGSIDPGTAPLFRALLLGLSAAAMLVLIPPMLVSAIREASQGKPGLDLLVAGGSVAAFGVSAANTIGGNGAIYFDTATMLPVLVTFGKMIEGNARKRAGALLHALETVLPDRARKIAGRGESDVPIDEVKEGDMIRIRPGERIPVDGMVIEGNTCIAEAPITGEFLPRDVGPGDPVVAGTVNGPGALTVRTTRAGKEVLLFRIVGMIRGAWQNRSQSERLAEKLAAMFIPLVLSGAVALFSIWTMAGKPEEGLLASLSFLVVACPCSLGIATPLATSLAIARAAGEGVIVRGGAIMEEISRIDTMFFDKTGTVTERSPALERVTVDNAGVTERNLLGRLATLEQASEHPLGQAVVAAAVARGIQLGTVEAVTVHPGSGLSGMVTWGGNREMVAAGKGSHGSTTIDVAWGGRTRGTVFFTEQLRQGLPEAVRKLGEMGIRTALLSGDGAAAAAAIGRRAGMGRIEAPCLPGEKLAIVSSEARSGKVVAMVGDGINDAPALAAASCGIAIGGGTDLARQAGDVVMLSDRPCLIPWLVRLGRRTARIVRCNLAWSVAYNAIAMSAAAAGVLHPLIAAVAMVVSSLTVLGNSLSIRSFPGVDGKRTEISADC